MTFFWLQEQIPLVVNVESAGIIGTLLTLKSDYEYSSGRRIHMAFTGASEADLLASEIAKAGVVITSLRPPGS